MNRLNVDWLIILGCVALVLLLGYILYDDAHAEKFGLRKDQWICTANKVETTYIVTASGKGTTNWIPDVHSVCTQYTKAGQ
jgi:hypothetical protein